MKCRHFGTCGSCTLYDLDYPEQLERKKRRVAGLLAPFWQGDFDLYDSPVSHYRARAEFRIWHKGDQCSYAMGNLEKNGNVTIGECPKVIVAIEERMGLLLEAVNASSELSRKLFGVEFLATTTGECLGRVTEVLSTGSNDVYVVRGRGREVLIPAIEDVVKEINLAEGRMIVKLIEGLI